MILSRLIVQLKLSLSVLCVLLVGCGGEGPSQDEMVEGVSGVVRWEGKPVSSAEVSFTSQDNPEMSTMALTDNQGQYTLSPLPAGTYRVQISRQGGASAQPDPRFAPYAGESSPLTAEISKDQKSKDFDLTN